MFTYIVVGKDPDSRSMGKKVSKYQSKTRLVQVAKSPSIDQTKQKLSFAPMESILIVVGLRILRYIIFGLNYVVISGDIFRHFADLTLPSYLPFCKDLFLMKY